MTNKQFKKGEVIFREGDLGNTLYQINNGEVGIYLCYEESDQQLLTKVTKDQIFGEMAVIEVYPRSATAVAITDVDVVEINSGEVNKYFESNPDKIMDMMKSLGGRLRDLSNDYDEVSATIKKLGESDAKEKSESLLESIKKFANVYKKSKVAEKISEETLRKISQKGHSDGYNTKVESYSKGTIIFKEGETGDCMYDVHFGSVGIYKDYNTDSEKLLTKLSPNEFFGELGLIDNVKRSATAVVLENDTTVEIIESGDLKELFKQNPPKVEMILEHISYRLRRLTKEYATACKLVYKVSEAEYKGVELSSEIKSELKGYYARLYD